MTEVDPEQERRAWEVFERLGLGKKDGALSPDQTEDYYAVWKALRTTKLEWDEGRKTAHVWEWIRGHRQWVKSRDVPRKSPNASPPSDAFEQANGEEDLRAAQIANAQPRDVLLDALIGTDDGERSRHEDVPSALPPETAQRTRPNSWHGQPKHWEEPDEEALLGGARVSGMQVILDEFGNPMTLPKVVGEDGVLRWDYGAAPQSASSVCGICGDTHFDVEFPAPATERVWHEATPNLPDIPLVPRGRWIPATETEPGHWEGYTWEEPIGAMIDWAVQAYPGPTAPKDPNRLTNAEIEVIRMRDEQGLSWPEIARRRPEPDGRLQSKQNQMFIYRRGKAKQARQDPPA